jgi:RNA polymerase sigma factor (sigma-70 family)
VREIEDEQLIEKAKQGSEHAYRLLVERYKAFVIRTILPIIRDPHDAEELAQEVFVRLYYSLSSYQAKGFKTWLTRLAVNYAIDEKRRRIRRTEKEELGEFENTSWNQVEEAVLKKEMQQLVRKKVVELPVNYRDIVVGYYIEEKSYKEIAAEQQLEIKTVEMKLYRARKWIKASWKEEEF